MRLGIFLPISLNFKLDDRGFRTYGMKYTYNGQLLVKYLRVYEYQLHILSISVTSPNTII